LARTDGEWHAARKCPQRLELLMTDPLHLILPVADLEDILGE
jgi:hypothetical protein